MVEDELSGSEADGGISEARQGSDPGAFLFVDHLARHLADQVFRKGRGFLDNVFRGVGLPSDGETDVAANLAVRVTGRTRHAAFGVAFEAVLRRMRK